MGRNLPVSIQGEVNLVSPELAGRSCIVGLGDWRPPVYRHIMLHNDRLYSVILSTSHMLSDAQKHLKMNISLRDCLPVQLAARATQPGTVPPGHSERLTSYDGWEKLTTKFRGSHSDINCQNVTHANAWARTDSSS